MSLWIHEWIIEPLRSLAAVVELVVAALAFCLFVLFLIYCVRKISRTKMPPKIGALNPVCHFIGGPLAGRYISVEPAFAHYFTVRPLPAKGRFTPSELPPCLTRVQYNRTGPNEFTAECEDHDWKVRDDSFDHEYGTEVIRTMVCQVCGAERPETRDDEPERDDI